MNVALRAISFLVGTLAMFRKTKDPLLTRFLLWALERSERPEDLQEVAVPIPFPEKPKKERMIIFREAPVLEIELGKKMPDD